MKLKIREPKLCNQASSLNNSQDSQAGEARQPLAGLDSSYIINFLENSIKERETPIIEKLKKGLLK